MGIKRLKKEEKIVLKQKHINNFLKKNPNFGLNSAEMYADYRIKFFQFITNQPVKIKAKE